ncbi:hypothetical protein D3C81_1593350 [compost metagenome]
MALHRAQAVRGHIAAVGHLHGHADHAAAAERHHHEVTRGHAMRGHVVETVVGRGIERHAHDWCRARGGFQCL